MFQKAFSQTKERYQYGESLQTDEAIKRYALWYYKKFAPSKNTLVKQVIKKTKKTKKEVEKIIQELESIFCEEVIIQQRINLFLTRTYDKQKIAYKLLQKWFEKRLIQKCMNRQKAFQSHEEKNEVIQQEVLTFLKKGKGSKYIRQTFRFREDISPDFLDQCLKLYQDIEYSVLKEQITHIFNQTGIPKDYFGKQKIFSKFMRRGYDYQDIKNILWAYNES